ncbi:Uncharacterised protein [Streptococcus pneumoniae]|uniref:hypothetical protein n=1 Tax=Streptococcus pneumoniae TaxID=1313 RepID=UPI000769415A|nr:hypothetical protein [Streptococcus pneumoniae]VJM82421.1 Uncharacterised protein [Streptococcus pneumoniae]HEW9196377.1 hypothetical protein [Streptococcus pneumoniae]HEW9620540.1 hypothetical protein [Streptococcus pneumoniae]
MDDILQALAKMLNMTVDEVSSLLTTFKGNAPQIYEMFVKEKMFYDLFSLFQIMSIVIFSISAVVLAVLTLIYFTYDGGFVYSYDIRTGKTEEEIKLERIERKRKDLKIPLKISCISSSASLITLVIVIVLKATLAPNYIFIVNEILPKLTKR